jgi:diacylglycerol O-acyltransferase / wax synthase
VTRRTEAHLRGSDAFSWYMERDPVLRSTIVTVAWLDRPPNWDRFVDRVDRATRLIPHFRDRVSEPPFRLATPRWVGDEAFDLAWHVRRQRVPPGAGRAAVLELARREAMAAFDPARPLWHATIVEGLSHGGAAAVVKLHHCLTDGVGGMQLAMLVFDLEEESPALPDLPPAPKPERVAGAPSMVADALATRVDQVVDLVRREAGAALPGAVGAALHPVGTVRRLAATAGSVYRTVAPIPAPLSPVMTDRHLGRYLTTIDIPHESLRAAARAAGGTLNDAFVAAVAGGLQRYHVAHGSSVDELRVTLPINIRRPDDPIGGNRITLQRCLVPTAIADPAERIRAVGPRILAARSEPAVPLTDAIAAGLNVLPPSVVGGILKHVDFLASNVPGPPVPVYLAGARMTGYHAFGPTIGASVNLTLISYCGTCNIGVNVDTAAVPDPERLVGALEAGFEEVLALAAPPLPSRHGSTRKRRAEGARRRPDASPVAAG